MPRYFIQSANRMTAAEMSSRRRSPAFGISSPTLKKTLSWKLRMPGIVSICRIRRIASPKDSILKKTRVKQNSAKTTREDTRRQLKQSGSRTSRPPRKLRTGFVMSERTMKNPFSAPQTA